jgi:PAS domain S-box-containing protein
VFDREEIGRAASEEVLRQMPAAVLIAEAPSGVIIFRNREAQQLRDRSMRKAWATYFEDAGGFQIYHPDGRPYESEEWPLMRSIRDGEEVRAEEFTYLLADGSELFMRCDSSPIYDEEGRIVAGIVVAYDNTERKRAEEALRYQLSLTETITDKAADPMLMLDAQGCVTFANPAAEQMFCWRREELLGEVLHDKLHHHYPDGRPYPRSECPIMDALATQRTLREHEDVFFRKDGSMVEISCSYAPFVVEGEVAGAVLVVRDITDRKQAEQEITRRTHQQAVVAELGLRALADGNLQDLMDDAVTLVGHTLDLDHSKIVELLPGGDELLMRAAVGWDQDLIGKATESAGYGSEAGYTLRSEGPVIAKDLSTERRFSSSALVLDEGMVSCISIIIHGAEKPFGVLSAHATVRRSFSEDDINFMQAVANVLAITIERWQAQQKLEEVRETERSRIARDLHEDALQDLSGALVDAQRLKAISSTDPEASRLSERLLTTLDRMGSHLRGAIYDLSLEREHDRPFDVLLEELVELHSTIAPHLHIALDVREGILEGPLGTTGREILRIIGEALNNTRRHSQATRVWVRVGISKGILFAEVEDEGGGCDATRNEPTPTASGTGVGGVGIRAMGERANQLGGELKLQSSESGQGTKVRFELALQRELEETEQREVRILLVDDHATIRDALAATFEEEDGFEVVGQAGSMAEARRMLEEIHPAVDVAVLDLGLPDGYGADLIKELREKNPRAQALVLSTTLDRTEIAGAVELGAAGVLNKTAHLDEVLHSVKRLRAGETLMPLEKVVELRRFAGSEREQEYEAHRAIEKLTPREVEVLQALAEGLDSEQIAQRLHISLRTERNHMANILSKLGVHSQLQALVFALRHGVVEIS